MMRKTLALTLALTAMLLLGACGSVTVTPAPTLAPTSTPTAPPTFTSTPLPTATATATPTPTPVPRITVTPVPVTPRPTATQYIPPTAAAGTFTNAEYGVSLRYPRGWASTPGKPTSSILTRFTNAGNTVVGILMAEVAYDKQSLPDFTSQMANATLNGLGLQNAKVISDKSLKLEDGRDAWSIVATGRAPNGVEFKFNTAAAIAGSRTFVLLLYGRTADYDASANDVTDLISAMRIQSYVLYGGLSRKETLVVEGGESTNPRDYDPATTHGSGNKMVFSGLVAYDPQLKLMPDLAESWEVVNGTIYTFKLRQNARFHNGRPVTAYDVIYSWERAANPKTKSDTVLTYLGDIVGVKEMKEGKADYISGLQALDAYTLQVTIDAPKPYFILKLTYPTAFVLDRENVESNPDWYRSPNGTGPYRVARWEEFKFQLYEQNNNYYLKPPAVPNVFVRLYTGNDIRLYETDEIDMADVGRYDISRVLDPKEPLNADLRSGVDLCTSYVTFDVKQPPFDDVKVRQAFVYAFDRQKYIDVVLQGMSLPAEGLYPPGLPGYNPDLEGMQYDPERARKLLAESKYGGPAALPPIIYTTGGLGSYVSGGVAAAVQMWQQTLGITLTIENIDPNKYTDEINAGHHGQIFGDGWCADYPDPENFADILFHTGAEHNRGNYSNPQVDALLEQARVEQNVTRRIQLYQRAEQLIVNDAPALFTTHSLSYVLIKPHIQGFVLTSISVPLERFLSIDPSKLR